ncbi:MAG TPA: flavin reductase family protein [Candidatus Polarisedimenticolia bacterium]|nr:flavin reductase family protein [Candidatus Polarisedimenticolia bacterium]
MNQRGPRGKAEIDSDKSSWQPTLLAGQVVLVSSRSIRGDDHAARKSWITMVASDPPMLGLCCRLSHRTAINILETRQFVVNIPGPDLADRVWAAGDGAAAALGPDDEPGWTYVPALKVSVSRVEECRGHIECTLESTRRLGDEELIFFARIVAVSLDQELLEGSPEERYRALGLMFCLEKDLFALLDTPRKVPSG